MITDEVPGAAEDVTTELESRGTRPVMIRPSALLRGTVGLDIEGSRAHVRIGESSTLIDGGTRVLLRRPGSPRPLPYSADWVNDFTVQQYSNTLRILYSLPAKWMNERLSAQRVESNKPLQASIAEANGLATIPTLVTNVPSTFSQFVCSCPGDIAIKPVTGWKGRASLPSESFGTYTQRMAKEAALALAPSVEHAPLIVQPYVEKAFELRVTVVGECALSCRIDSQVSQLTATDWRHYDLSATPHTAYPLPSNWRDSVARTVAACGLAFAAVDLIVTPEGELVFVELNPSGQYGWIEDLSGLQITRAIADWLLNEAGDEQDYYPL